MGYVGYEKSTLHVSQTFDLKDFTIIRMAAGEGEALEWKQRNGKDKDDGGKCNDCNHRRKCVSCHR